MKFYTLALCFLTILFLTNCKSPTEQIKEAFKTIDNSLVKSNSFIDNSIGHLYSTIDSSRQKNIVLVLKADSVLNTTNIACNFIDSLKEVIKKQDTTGVDIELSTNIFLHSRTSDILKAKILDSYNCSFSTMTTTAEKNIFDSIFSSAKELQFDKNWKETYFGKTPTVGTLAILSKFRSDCKNGATFSLENINSKLIK